MIRYRSKNWLLVLLCFYKSPIIWRILVFVLVIGAYAALVTYLTQTGVIGMLQLGQNLFPLFMVLLSLLLAFRTNSAYDHWWEGRKLWEELVNNTRNLAIFLDSTLDLKDMENRQAFASDISAYARAVNGHLKGLVRYDDVLELDVPTILQLKKLEHIPNALASRISRRIYELSKKGLITGYELINLKRQIAGLTDIIGGCERIKTTPIPFSYNSYVKHLVFWFCMALPFGLQSDYGYLSVPLTMVAFAALVGLEMLAADIEDPFGSDENDLPTDELTSMIRRNVNELLLHSIPEDEAVPPAQPEGVVMTH